VSARASRTESAILSPPRGLGVPALYVGLVADAPQTPPFRIGLGGVDVVEVERADARAAVRTIGPTGVSLRLGLADSRLSSRHARLTRIGTSWALEDLGSKNGTWIAGVATKRQRLAVGDAFRVGHSMLVVREYGGCDGADDADPPALPRGLRTLSQDLSARFADLARAAATSVAIEIRGETGTGKELVARAVHDLSRRTGTFVAVNCGAIAETLAEAELFGHRRGAFTGADSERVGYVRMADGGTLFLDEIAELAPSSQASLLRVLQEGEVVPVGSDRPVRVDLRVVIASHVDLDQAVRAGRFRADLRARLLGFQIDLPALRARREDIAFIVADILARAGRSVTFSADAAAALYAHAWPLNIRELERALTTALAVARDHIELSYLPAALRSIRGDEVTEVDEDAQLRERVIASLARHEGNVAAVARELGRDRKQIRRWMKRFGLSRPTDDQG
jgi:pSer/pThr/pTyr-binding forkhead associated (FHA) protein